MIDLSIALKDAPNGLNLYSPFFGDVTLEKVKGDFLVIKCQDKEYQIDKHGKLEGVYVNDDECKCLIKLQNNGKCILYPHQDAISWEFWQSWVLPQCIGSVIVDEYGNSFLVDEDYMQPVNPNIQCDKIRIEKFDFTHNRFATPKETKTYFSELESNGFEWNHDEKKMLRKTRRPEPNKVSITQIMAGDSFLLNGKMVEVVVINLMRDLVGVIGDYSESLGIRYIKVSNLEPIQITEDLLVRNGLTKVHDCNLSDLFDNVYETDDKQVRMTDISTSHGEGVWYLHIDDDDMDTLANVVVDSFHDLQHAYKRYNVKRDLVL